MNKQEQAFVEKVATLEKGERLEYWRGPHCAGPLKHIAASLYEEGEVLLVSKRHGPGDTEYMVVKRKKRKKK